MLQTQHLKLPYLAAAQSQKHITHNEALRALDAIIQPGIITATFTEPPEQGVEGARYIVAGSASGLWQGRENQIAAFQDGGWLFYMPQNGWIVWVFDTAESLVFHNDNWQSLVTAGSTNPAPLVGVNMTADTDNKLAVKSDNVLLSHDGDDMRLKINKAGVGDTASLLFQKGFSGRAEMGLSGDDDFHVKVSDDGNVWKEGLVVDNASGHVQMPQNALTENLVFNLLKDAGRFAGSPESTSAIAAGFTAPPYLFPYNGAQFSAYGKFIHNNSTHGGTQAALLPEVDSLMARLKSTVSGRRYGPEFHLMKIIAGSGTVSAATVNGVTRYFPFVNRSAPLWFKSTWGLNVKVLSGSLSADVSPTQFSLYKDGTEQISGSIVLENVDGWVQLIWVGQQNPEETIDYQSTLFKIRAALGSEFLVGLPFIVPAQLIPKPNILFGRVPSLEVWR